jgi:hypothetical protein
MSNAEKDARQKGNDIGTLLPPPAVEKDVHRIECDCGYVVEGLSAARAELWARQHADDEHDCRVIPPGVGES